MTRKVWFITAILIAGGFAYYTASRPMDFRVYHHGARGIFEGIRPWYGVWSGFGWPMHYRYPPLFLLLFAPFAVLPLAWGAAAWVTLKVAVLFGLLKTFARRGLIPASVFVVVLLAGPYIVEEFRYGNAQFFVFALAAASLLLARERRLLSAASLALAISLKVWPMFFVPYLAARRDWKVAAATLGFVVLFALLPSFYLGFQGNLNLLQEWYSQESEAQFGTAESWFPNQSLRGMLMRYLTVMDYSQFPDSNYAQVNITTLDPELVRVIWIAMAGAIYLIFLFIAYRRHDSNGWLDHALAFCLLPLLQPFTQKYSLAVLLWPALAAGILLGKRRFVVPIYVATILVLLQPLAPGAATQRLLQVLGFDFAANALLAAALVGASLKFSNDSFEF